MSKTVFDTTAALQAVGPCSIRVTACRLLFASGPLPLDRVTGIIDYW